MPGLDPGIHRKEALHSRMMDRRGISAFTRVFDALCPAMTADRRASAAAGITAADARAKTASDRRPFHFPQRRRRLLIAPPLGPYLRFQRGCGVSTGLSTSESGSVSSTIAATRINAVGTPSASPATP